MAYTTPTITPPAGAVLGTAAPQDVTKSAAVVGVGTTSSPVDHKHDISTAAPATTLAPSTSNTEGAATSLARSNHVHAVSTALVADIQPVGATAAAGTADNFARGDHVHLDTGLFTSTVQTTNATVTTVATITPADGTCVFLESNVAARKTDGTNAAGMQIRGVFRRTGATTTQVSTSDSITFNEGANVWDVSLTTSGSDILLQVTGQAATTIDWRVRGRTVAAP